MLIAQIFVYALLVYTGLGLLFAALFVWKGVHRMDPAAQRITIGFRLIIVPGVIALWPVLFWRWTHNFAPSATEQNAHRELADRLISSQRRETQ